MSLKQQIEVDEEMMASAEKGFLAAAGNPKSQAETKARFARNRQELEEKCKKERANLFAQYTNAMDGQFKPDPQPDSQR